MNWPATGMSGAICVHGGRVYIKAMHTFLTFFVPSHDKPQLFCFKGNMQSSIVPIQCTVLHVTKLACTCVHAGWAWQLTSIY